MLSSSEGPKGPKASKPASMLSGYCLPSNNLTEGIAFMVGHPCHNYGLITRFEVCNALRIWGYALCDSRSA